MKTILLCFSSLVAGQEFLRATADATAADGHRGCESLNPCLDSCNAANDAADPTCQFDGSTDCSNSRCCKGRYDTCFRKNTYWAACKSTCAPGEADGYDPEPWACTPLYQPLTECIRACQPQGWNEKPCIESCIQQTNSASTTVGQCLQQCVQECPDGPSPAPSPPNGNWNQCLGALNYVVDGKLRRGYIMDAPLDRNRGDGITLSNTTITVTHGSRLYLTHTCQESITPDMFKTINLLGKTITYTVDLRKVSCGCNAAVYMVTMPAGSPTSCKDYYCDANAVCGTNCAELDLMEGNTHAWATTPHHAYSHKGCEHRAANYGPGQTIDPARGYIHVTTKFYGGDGHLDKMETTLRQKGGHEITIVHDASCGWDLQNIGQDMGQSGMVLTFSNWGSDANSMAWLDGDVCGSDSCSQGAMKVSHITVMSGYGDVDWQTHLDEAEAMESVFYS